MAPKSQSQVRKIFITGGHLTPALAVIDALMEAGGWQIYFVGRKYSQEGKRTISTEYQLLGSSNQVTFLAISTGRLQRALTRYTLTSLFKIPLGFVQSFFWFVKYQPDITLSFGGYIGVPVALTSWLLGIPVITHEQTQDPGLSNKIISHFAKKVLLSWPADNKSLETKFVFTGNPLRKEIFQVKKTEQFRRFQKIKSRYKSEKVLYFTGGNQGSHHINQTVQKALPTLLKKYIVLHSTGEGDFEKFSQLQSTHEKYFPYKFIETSEIGWVLKNADIVIGRSGANTVSEISALGKVAILIPLPWSAKAEQYQNAKLLTGFKGAVILDQSELSPDTLIEIIEKVVKNFSHLSQNAKKAVGLTNPDAAQLIVSQLEKVLS